MQKAWPVKKKRSGKKIAFAMILILSVAAFGYSQYSAITSISSTMINSQDMGAVPLGHMYKILHALLLSHLNLIPLIFSSAAYASCARLHLQLSYSSITKPWMRL